jgi:hypothetical protein
VIRAHFWSSLLVLTGQFLAGCSGRDTVAGGGSNGSEAGNSIAVRIANPDGTPAIGALVRVRKPDYLNRDTISARILGVVDSSFCNVRTGLDGSVRIDGLRTGLYRLEAIQEGAAVQILESVGSSPQPERALILRPTGSLWGRVAKERAGAWVGILGTDHRIQTDSAGGFQIPSIPVGPIGVQTLDGSERGFQIIVPKQSVTVGEIRAEKTGQLFLDDFEDGDNRNRYAIPTGDGFWYAALATGMTSSSDTIPREPYRAIVADSVTGNKFLQWSVSNPQKLPEAWAEFGVALGVKNVDLRNLQSVAFRARGVGNVAVRIHSAFLGSKQFFDAKVALTPKWTDYSLPIASFKGVGNKADTLSVPLILSSCEGIAFSFGPDGSLSLDDVRMTGVDPVSLWGNLIAP